MHQIHQLSMTKCHPIGWDGFPHSSRSWPCKNSAAVSGPVKDPCDISRHRISPSALRPPTHTAVGHISDRVSAGQVSEAMVFSVSTRLPAECCLLEGHGFHLRQLHIARDETKTDTGTLTRGPARRWRKITGAPPTDRLLYEIFVQQLATRYWSPYCELHPAL